MAERVCPKCGSAGIKVERSPLRLSLRCQACNWRAIKNIISKGGG